LLREPLVVIRPSSLVRAIQIMVQVGALAMSPGCAHGPPPPAAALSPPARLCERGARPPLCREARGVEAMLRAADLTILGSGATGEGIQGAKVLTLALRGSEGRVVFRAKWRPYSVTSSVSQPRNELAAYAIQKLFLDETDYVVPPVAGHCFPLHDYRRVEPDAEPSFPRLRCAFGFLSYWREDVVSLDTAEEQGWFESERGPFDEHLFLRDPVYRSSIGEVNLLTYFIDHDDSHSDQFMLARKPGHTSVTVVDNSMCLLSPWNDKLERDEDWSRFQVPALPRRALERLVRLTDDEIATLQVIEQHELRDGLLVSTPGSGAPARGDPSAGMRWATRDRLQVGLTDREIALLRLRRDSLSERASRHEYRLF
jgi:hypothetical protein